MARWQYQIWAFVPQQPAVVTVTLDWYVQHPEPQSRPWRLDQFVSASFDQTAEQATLDWLVQSPTLTRPSRLLGGATWTPQHQAAEGSALDWLPRYPDAIPRWTVRAADQPFFTWSGAPGHFPIADLRWQGRYPDRVWRITLSAAAIPTLAFDPFPQPGVTRLSAWAIYPDRINRATLPVAGMPSFAFGTLDPIPNVAVALEDRILLGQNQSIETPAYPSIGGSSTWS